MTRINSKLKVAGILLAALVLALVSVVQISATPYTDPVRGVAYLDTLAESRSANPDVAKSPASAAPVEVKLVDVHTWWQGHMQANAVQPAAAAPVEVKLVDVHTWWQGHMQANALQPAAAAQPAYGSPAWIAAHPGQAIDGDTATSP